MSAPEVTEMRCQDCDEVMPDVAEFGTRYECPECGMSAEVIINYRPSQEDCHICGEPKDEPGAAHCSAGHPRSGEGPS